MGYLDRVFLRGPGPQEGYLARLPAVKALVSLGEEGLIFPSPVTFLVGENGTGKSTLLEAIAVCCGFNAEGGTRNFRFSTRETHSALHQFLTVARTDYPRDGFFFRAESFYNVATNIDELDQGPSFGPPSLTATAVYPSTSSPTGRAFLPWWSTASAARASTCWTSPRPPSLPPA